MADDGGQWQWIVAGGGGKWGRMMAAISNGQQWTVDKVNGERKNWCEVKRK